MFNNKPPGRPPRRPDPKAQYGDFEAVELFCPKCKQAMPVRRRLLLVLPEGEKYEYLCARCMTSVGEKIVKDAASGTRIII
jgi:hypothetical protein